MQPSLLGQQLGVQYCWYGCYCKASQGFTGIRPAEIKELVRILQGHAWWGEQISLTRAQRLLSQCKKLGQRSIEQVEACSKHSEAV